MPKLIPNQFTVASDTQVSASKVLVGYIEPNSPAANAGLRSTDQLIAIEQTGYSPVNIDNKEQLPRLTKVFAGKQVKVFYVGMAITATHY